MIQLRSRDKFPPGGFRFYQPETNFSPPPWLSFHDTVAAIVSHRHHNPHQAKQFAWSLDFNAVADELDLFNAKVALESGWYDFIQGAGVPENPKPLPPRTRSPLSGTAVAAGAKSLLDWTIDGEIVPTGVAEGRAALCAQCPVNRKGTLADWFTEKAANLIQRQFEIRAARELKTGSDEHLGLCDACGCPLKLKVFAPLRVIQKYLSPEVEAKLWEKCWIR
jgi:hypothetical protein